MQNSCQLVKKAIEFETPERIPYNFDENRQNRKKDFGDDFIWLFLEQAPDFKPGQEGENELGVIYKSLDGSFGQPNLHPLENMEKVTDFRIPDYGLSSRYNKIEERIKANVDKYMLGMWPHFLFLTCLELCGFEKLMLSFYNQPEHLRHLIKMLSDSCIKVVDQMASRGVNGIIAIEDLGVQDRLFISPQMWRLFFKPAYERIFEHAHKKGLHVFMHSCGYIFDIIEDLIEVGLDVIQIDQQDNMGLEKLSERYSGRICFFCPVDIQTILPIKNNFTEIENRAKSLIQNFGNSNGGFIAKTYPQPEGLNIPDENTEYMCDMFKKYGTY